MRTALFIGRFQPFHNGHLFAVKDILKKCRKIIIAIGSSQESDTKENPFSYEERKEMIENALQCAGIKNYVIAAVHDISNHAKWVEHVCSCVGKFDVVYTGSELTKKLFSEKGFSVENLLRHGEISASDIRKRIVEGEDWTSLVPDAIILIVKKKAALIRELENT